MKLTKRKDGRWMYNYSPGEGQKVKPFYSSEETESKAEKDIIRKIANWKEKEDKGSLFSSVADAWNTEYRLNNNEVNYRKNMKAAYERTIEYFGQAIHIKDITAKDLNLYLKKLAAMKYSKKTVVNHKNILNMIFKYALLNDYISYNPVRDISIPDGLSKKKRDIPATSTLKEIQKHNEGFDLLPYFILNTGCRKSEALAITSSVIDRKRKRVKIENHVIHDGNRPIFEPVLKTESAEREIILPDRLLDAIPEKFEGFLFSMNNDGKEPLTKCAYKKRWDNYCKKYKIQITAHQLRHGYATMLFEAGIDVKDAQELMGHSDINLTRQIYTHIRPERKEQTANAINNFTF